MRRRRRLVVPATRTAQCEMEIGFLLIITRYAKAIGARHVGDTTGNHVGDTTGNHRDTSRYRHPPAQRSVESRVLPFPSHTLTRVSRPQSRKQILLESRSQFHATIVTLPSCSPKRTKQESTLTQLSRTYLQSQAEFQGKMRRTGERAVVARLPAIRGENRVTPGMHIHESREGATAGNGDRWIGTSVELSCETSN